MMRAEDVLEVLSSLEGAGIAVWLDGGWGVDALLGAQHRPHDDVDVVVALAQMTEAHDALASLGFIMQIDERPTRSVLRDPVDRRIDFHTVTFDATGAATQRLPDGTDCLYPADGFTGRGVVGRRAVRCLTAEVQLLHHCGYEPDDDDRHDVRLLCDRFGLIPPHPYEND